MTPENLELLNNCIFAAVGGIFVGVLAVLLYGNLP
jgi:hypothetical protein